MMFCLVRTEQTERRQEGISFLLIDMKTPGITVRPIITLDEDHEVNEVFLDNVRVPVANLVGEEGKGWTYAKYLLGHERTGIAAVGRSKRELGFLKRLAGDQVKNGRPLIDDPLFAAKVASIEIELMALEMTVLRVVSQEGAKKGPGPEASMLKIKGTEIQQGLSELMLEAAGPLAMPFEPALLESGEADGRRRPGRFRRGAARAALLQLPQDVDLRRIERDPEEHHLADDPRPLTEGTRMDFDFTSEQTQLADSVRRLVEKDYGFETRKKIVTSQDGHERRRLGASSSTSASPRCRCRRRTAASTARRSTCCW